MSAQRGKVLGIVSITLALTAVLFLESKPVEGEAKGKGVIVRSYREDKHAGRNRPGWADAAERRAKRHVMKNAKRFGNPDVDRELTLRTVEEDDLGQTHVRLDQVHNGVPVFGRQLIVQMDATTELDIFGAFQSGATVDTTPSLTAEEAIQFAKASVPYPGPFANEPEANLVILPAQDGTPIASLTYMVELVVDDGTEAAAIYQVFIDAMEGRTLWQYDRLANGTGYSLYSGTVALSTARSVSGGRYVYTLQDLSRRTVTTDMQSQMGETLGFHFVTYNDVWGNGTLAHLQSAAVDAHFGAARAWDYFYQRHGRLGLDGTGSWVTSRVHYGSRFGNAFSNGAVVTFGDGDGYNSNPWVSVDLVGHEIGHSVIAYTIPSVSRSGLLYAGESGAANESFADIFGTAVEFYTGIRPDYAIGEDIYTPFLGGDAMRYMFNPPADGRSVDHYSRRKYPVCVPSEANDKCGVHSNSGIQNKVFYLLAAGGTHYGVTVPSITRINAERIFYRALFKLHEQASFRDVRYATQAAAIDLFGASSGQYVATVRAWDAVGVPR